MQMTNSTRKIYNGLLLMVFLVLLSTFSEPLQVQAAPSPTYEAVSTDEPMVLSFSTSSVTSSSQNNGIMDVVRVALTYVAYPVSNPGSQQRETVLLDNNKDISFSRSFPVSVTGTNGVNYTGTFTFSVYYNSANSTLKVDGVDVGLGSRILRTANVYPEAYVDPAVVGIDMNPLPFSQVKAVTSGAAGYVDEFNARVNSGITQTITLTTASYGTGATSTTTLSMYVWKWKRLPDGTYDKSQAATRVQVIYSAADLLNGAATYASWTGTQLFRQLVPAASTGYSAGTENIITGYATQRVYTLQNYAGSNYSWGYNGVIGDWSGIQTGTCTSSSSRNCSSPWYQYARYEIQCSDYWRFNYAYAWSSSSSVGDSFCKANTPTRPYYRKVNSTQNIGWTTLSSMSGYSRTASGYKYQTSIETLKWGGSYKTTDAPSLWQLNNNLVRIVSMADESYPIITAVSKYYPVATTLGTLDNLTEGGVNSRTYEYAVGLANRQILAATGLSVDAYWATIDANASSKISQANTEFKEGYYWGLYLYVTGHWRAVEVPISWYEISGSTTTNASLAGTLVIPPPPPDPETETEISLTDFTYIQSVFNQIKSQNAGSSISEIQTMFMSTLRDDKNKAAQKIVLYYDTLVINNISPAQAYEAISRDFNLNLITK